MSSIARLYPLPSNARSYRRIYSGAANVVNYSTAVRASWNMTLLSFTIVCEPVKASATFVNYDREVGPSETDRPCCPLRHLENCIAPRCRHEFASAVAGRSRGCVAFSQRDNCATNRLENYPR